MHQLQQPKPGVWYEFENGGVTVNTNPVPFTAIGVDQAQEHINKVHKGHGCISGLTNSPDALLRYCLRTPVLARLADETEQMLGITQPTRTQHHDLRGAQITRQENYIRQLKETLSKANLFTVVKSSDGTELHLVHLTNNMIMPQDVQQNILNTEIRGKAAYKLFVDERICGDTNLWDKMTKVKVLGWNSAAKTIKARIDSDEVMLKASTSLMAHLLVITRSYHEIATLIESLEPMSSPLLTNC